MPPEKPEIRLIHHMARTGGTIISRSVSAMQNVYLLSEIHPLGTNTFNPFEQAQSWYQLLTDEDMRLVTGGENFSFAAAIELISDRVIERNGYLVIRDWSHLDFTGIPFVQNPSYQLLLAKALVPNFTIHSIATVRHPIDQWLSLRQITKIKGVLSLADYLAGYRRFADAVREIGFVRYEDFVRSPDHALGEICNALQLPFDPEYQKNMQEQPITGDNKETGHRQTISAVPRKSMEDGLTEQFKNNPDYQAATRILGYAD